MQQSNSLKGDSPIRKRKTGPSRSSCCECRRLKLRCDRATPCSNCVKKGCGAICPDGSLTTGQGNRFVLASTEELHKKILQLSTRVRELEDALRSVYQRYSRESHPLLSEEALKIKAPLQRDASADAQNNNNNQPRAMEVHQEPDQNVVDAFGSLSISLAERNRRRFGHTAGSEYDPEMLDAFGSLSNSLTDRTSCASSCNDSSNDDEPEKLLGLRAILPEQILACASSFPIVPSAPVETQTATTIVQLCWYLPASPTALKLRTVFYQRAASLHIPIQSKSFQMHVYGQFYQDNQPDVILPPPLLHTPHNIPQILHRLAIAFMVFSIGSLLDTSAPAFSIEAEKYNQLARAALFQTSIFENPTVQSVQALFLMVYYLFLRDKHGQASNTRWVLMALAAKLAQSIGLHRDSGRWADVDPEEVSIRRDLYWEMVVFDTWQCLTYGRPPSFNLLHGDTKMPDTGPESEENSFHVWKRHFACEFMSRLHDMACDSTSSTYSAILALEQKIRPSAVPPILQLAGFSGLAEPTHDVFSQSDSLVIQRHVVFAIREIYILHLHRSYFACAVRDYRKDPLSSPYGNSVLAAYRSAGCLVAFIGNLHNMMKELSERLWFMWAHMFSCSVVLGSIVILSPSMTLAPSALAQLDSACELFSKVAVMFNAQNILTAMVRLQTRAHESLDNFRRGNEPSWYGNVPESLPIDSARTEPPLPNATIPNARENINHTHHTIFQDHSSQQATSHQPPRLSEFYSEEARYNRSSLQGGVAYVNLADYTGDYYTHSNNNNLNWAGGFGESNLNVQTTWQDFVGSLL